MAIIGKTYAYEVSTRSKAIEIVAEYLEKYGHSLGSRIDYSVEDLSDDVEQVTLGVVLKITPPRLMTQRGLEQVVFSLRDATCIWSE
tara:strand:- start:775 stop:1035 length:261 start_codon:yes stop_codon:yes gene_type:complete